MRSHRSGRENRRERHNNTNNNNKSYDGSGRKHQPSSSSSSSRRGGGDNHRRNSNSNSDHSEGEYNNDHGSHNMGNHKEEQPFESDHDDDDDDEGEDESYNHSHMQNIRENDVESERIVEELDELVDDATKTTNYDYDVEDATYCTDQLSRGGQSSKVSRNYYRGESDGESDLENARDTDLERLRASTTNNPNRGAGGAGAGAGGHHYEVGSPELNPNRRNKMSDRQKKEEMPRHLPLTIAPPPPPPHSSSDHSAAADRAGGSVAPSSIVVAASTSSSSAMVEAKNAAASASSSASDNNIIVRKSSSDPPTKNYRPCTPPQAVDPNYEETKSLFSRLDAPPTPEGPERNKLGGSGSSSSKDGKSCKKFGGGGYSNYKLDDEGVRQYKETHERQQPQQLVAAHGNNDDERIDDGMSKVSLRGQDPPELGRGRDPKQVGSADPPESKIAYGTKKKYHRGGNNHAGSGGGGGGGRSGKSGRDARGGGGRHSSGRKEEADVASNKKEEQRKKKSSTSSSAASAATKPQPPQPEIKSILRKKGGPIPITQFGKPVPPVAENNTSDDSDDDNSYVSTGSDPDMIEQKSTRSAATANDDHDDEGTVKSAGTKSGLRSGKYASFNAAAARKQNSNGGDDSDDQHHHPRDHDDYESDVSRDYTNDDYTDYSGYSGNYTANDDGTFVSHINDEDSYAGGGGGGGGHTHAGSDADSDDNTLKSITTNSNTRFDRSKSNFMRTADLGMTQDTIFAEQFLDDPNSRAEPHYHHPSPHPPPGVQFHIDENWVCLDDGKGSHSPIAPQAVDALVAMGYRAACDPMMWTPTSKTRKYMTEKGLRFDDIPIPGPLDEGDGGPNDSTCLVWSGKFPHKYHGHEQPAVRSQGVVNMSPEDLVDLLMDSRRVGEYNKSSIGRTDEVVLSDGTNLDSCPFSGQRKKKLTGVVMQGAKVIDGNAVFDSETEDEQSDVEEIEELVFDDDGRKSVHTFTTSSTRKRRQSNFVGVTKLVLTKNKPPLVRKVLEFFTLLHCRALTDDQGGDGYIIVGRGIIPATKAEKSGKKVLQSEILLNVHIIRKLRSSKKRRDRERGSSSSSRGSRSSKTVSTSGRKASKGDLANRCLMISVNHLKSPMVPNMLAKKVGLSAALNFMSDIRGLTE